MNNIYLLTDFNNYYNRKMIRYDTLAEYLNVVGNNYQLVSNVVNFTPNDGISTQQVFNFATYPLQNSTPNYMLVCDDNDDILQRWFVIDTQRTRAGQYTFNLYRDVVAEAWNSIQDAPIFVEKGILSQNDPMIFNHEDMTFNQVKQKEILLKDKIGIPWIIGYMTQDAVSTQQQSFIPDYNANYTVSALSGYQYYSYSQYGSASAKVGFSGYTYYVNCWMPDGSSGKSFNFNDDLSGSTSYSGANPGLIIGDTNKEYSFREALKARASGITDGVRQQEGVSADNISAENGKIIYVSSTGKYYEVTLQAAGSTTITKKSVAINSTAYTAFSNAVVSANTVAKYLTTATQAEATAYAFQYSGTITTQKLYLRELASKDTVSYSVSNTRALLQDQPYSMFCLPYGYTTFDGWGEDEEEIAKDFSKLSMQVAKDICSKYGGSNAALYDLQLLPFCPIIEYINGNDYLDVSNMTEGKDFDYIMQDNEQIGAIFWAKKSKSSFTISQTISVSDYKLDNETKTYRLCSPNYNGQFEFSAAMNGGVSKFNVDYTYRPYNPYIHINPIFGRMYGSDFKDARGLVCGGKFDLPQTSDAWASYERSNSNYNSIFDRNIQSLELKQSIQRKMELWGVAAGTVSGITSGASMGAAGGVAGAVAGGIAGGLASAVGGALDINYSDKLRQENIDLQKDQFGYQLGNIQAMPESITNVGSLTNNNKLFPFLEIYSATEAEVEALKDKIRYNGMKVGRIGTISEFFVTTWSYSNGWNYFKGQLIRADVPGEDWHFVNTLKNELNMGIYM